MLLGGGEVAATLPADLAGRQQSDLAVGDEVLVERRGDSHRVTAVLPRRSLLARADPHVAQRRRAIAANVDLVVVVVAAEAPPLHPRLIDRYLIAVEHSGARPVLVVNKVDLLDEDAAARPARAAPAVPGAGHAGAAVQRLERGEGIDEVRAALAGNTCVFVGQSGVGKSSLLNALDGDAAARIGAVRDGDGRGRHTTTASALYELAGGIRVIDTPGIRRFSVEDADPAAHRRRVHRVRAARRRLPLPRLHARARARLRRRRAVETARSRAAATRATASCSAATATTPTWFETRRIRPR